LWERGHKINKLSMRKMKKRFVVRSRKDFMKGKKEESRKEKSLGGKDRKTREEGKERLPVWSTPFS